VETLVYISIWTLVVGLGLALFWKTFYFRSHLNEKCGLIAQVLRSGEQWRAAVRTGGIIEVRDGGQAIKVGQDGVFFGMKEGEFHRWKENEKSTRLVPKIKQIQFLQRNQNGVLSWSMEITLKNPETSNRKDLVFVFRAVPGKVNL
jgi:hypothetical protein